MSGQSSLFLTLLHVASPVPALAETQPVPRFEPSACPTLAGAEELDKASCGYLVVPENRSQPNGRTIRLLVAKYPASSPEKQPDPVIYLVSGIWPASIWPAGRATSSPRAGDVHAPALLLSQRRSLNCGLQPRTDRLQLEVGHLADAPSSNAGCEAMRALDLNSARRAARGALSILLGLFVALALSGPAAQAADPDPAVEARIVALVPKLESYIAEGMTAFDSPGLAICIVAGDNLVYAKGFGVRKKGGEPVDTRTVFQAGSVTKGFLATTLAIAVDRGKFRWDDRVVDLDPEFQLKDPWVTSEFRMFDLMAQSSGLPAYVNDMLNVLGFDRPTMIRSLRHVDPVSSFHSTSPTPASPTSKPATSSRRARARRTGRPCSARISSSLSV